MALKGIYDAQDDIPAPLREYALEKEGKWVLDVEGYVTKDTLDSFRTNNRKLNNDNEKLKKDLEALQTSLVEVQTKFKDIDPDEYKALKTAPSDIQKQIAEAEGRIKHTYEQTYGARFAEFEARAKEAEQKLHMETIKAEIAKWAPKVGVRDTAIEDIQRRAIETFQILDGKPVPMQGTEPRYSEKSPSKYMEPEEWISSLVPTHPHYFEASSGGGATGGLGGRSMNGHRVIAASDKRSFLNNLEAIAKGTVEVDLEA
jgi:hypothetical protein